MGSRRDPETGLVRRGTSNTNERGSAEQRRRRKVWLLETYAANRKMLRVEYEDGRVEIDLYVIDAVQMLAFSWIASVTEIPTARCYRCGCALHFETLTVDRIIPGCKGGTYRRTNIRPACGDCNSETGGPLANSKVHRPAKRAAQKRKTRDKVAA